MCIIVDANAAAQLCQPELTPAAEPVVDWIENRGGRVIHGGELTRQLIANRRVGRWLRALFQAGRASQVAAAGIAAEVQLIRQSRLCRSNDLHILAVARISGARILFSYDQSLHADFTNPALLNQPRGKVYQNAGHRNLLTSDACRA